MMLKEISGFMAAGLCLSVLLTAGLIGAAGQIYSNPSVYNVPQNAQDRADIYKALVSLDGGNGTPAITDEVDPYSAMDNPYGFKDPQADLERANAYKAVQKLNDINYGAGSGNTWYYWTNMWLNDPKDGAQSTYTSSGSRDPWMQADAYSAMDSPYAFKNPQAGLDRASTYKAVQKLNDINYGSPSGDNWYYWTNMWLNEP